MRRPVARGVSRRPVSRYGAGHLAASRIRAAAEGTSGAGSAGAAGWASSRHHSWAGMFGGRVSQPQADSLGGLADEHRVATPDPWITGAHILIEVSARVVGLRPLVELVGRRCEHVRVPPHLYAQSEPRIRVAATVSE